MRKLLLALVALGLLTACAATSAPGAMPASGPVGQTTDAIGRGIGAPESDHGFKGETTAGGAPNSVPLPQVADPTRQLILTANISMRSEDPWAASDRAQAVATSLGGDVMSLSQSGSGDERSASLVLRVPSDRFNDALKQLRELTGVEILSSNVDSRDVTEQFVDLEARLRARQAEEQRYLALLARAESVEDILKVDQALSNVRVEIERLTGQLNSIKSRTTFSTIAVSVVPLGIGPITEPGVYDPSKTIERAITALGVLLRSLADLAIWLLIFGWIPLLAAGIYFAMRRAGRTTAGPAHT